MGCCCSHIKISKAKEDLEKYSKNGRKLPKGKEKFKKKQKNKIKILRSDTEIDAAKGKETTPTLLQAKEKIPNSPQFQPSYWNPTGG